MAKKGGLLVAIGMGPARKGGAKPEPDADEPDSDDYAPDEGEVAAAENAISCQKAGDAEGFAKAICNLIDMHSARG